MSSLVDSIHRLLDWGITPLFSRLGSLGELAVLIVVSLISGVVLVCIYGRISFQAQLRWVKRSIHAALLEVILFRHSPWLSLQAQGRMLKGGVLYVLLAIPPILILAVPCIFLMAQLQSWFGYQPLAAGSSVIVRAALPNNRQLEQFSLVTDPSVQVLGPLRNSLGHELVWRLQPQHAGRFPLELKLSDTAAISAELVVDSSFARIDARLSSLFTDKFLYPARASATVPKDTLERFEVLYPQRTFVVWGYRLHWVILFLLVSILSGILGGKLLKVEL